MVFGELVPILQTLIWILFVSILLFLTRSQLAAILRALTKNIEKGSTVETPWFKLGQISPKQEDTLPGNPSPIDYLRSIYLRHIVGEWEEYQDSVKRRRIVIWLDFLGDEIWGNIIKVIYYFLVSYPQRVITRTNKDEWFSVETAAIGEFSVGAEIFLEGNKDPIRISRYIDFSDFRQTVAGKPLMPLPKINDSSGVHQGVIAMPIKVSDKLMGLLSIQNPRPSHFISFDNNQIPNNVNGIGKNVEVLKSKAAKQTLITKKDLQNMQNREPKILKIPKNQSGKMKKKSKKK